MDNWQIECCEPPPGEGDAIAWPLHWVEDPAGPGAVRIAWQAESLPADAGVLDGLLLRQGPLTAFWHAPTPVPEHGRLVADVHGGVPELVPRVRGRVVAVQVIEQAYRLAPPRTYVPVPGDFVLHAVERSPRWFSDESDVAPGEDLPAVDRQQSGVLVRIAVEPA